MEINQKIILWIVAILFTILIIIILLISSTKYYNNKKINELKHYEESRTQPQQIINNIEQNNINLISTTDTITYLFNFEKNYFLGNYIMLFIFIIMLYLISRNLLICIISTGIISLIMGMYYMLILITLLIIPIFLFRNMMV